jgi:hypothetical protein
MRSCNRIVDQLKLMQNGVGVEFSLHRVVQPVLDQPRIRSGRYRTGRGGQTMVNLPSNRNRSPTPLAEPSQGSPKVAASTRVALRSKTWTSIQTALTNAIFFTHARTLSKFAGPCRAGGRSAAQRIRSS